MRVAGTVLLRHPGKERGKCMIPRVRIEWVCGRKKKGRQMTCLKMVAWTFSARLEISVYAAFLLAFGCDSSPNAGNGIGSSGGTKSVGGSRALVAGGTSGVGGLGAGGTSSAASACNSCISACQGLSGCCTGTGCICESECNSPCVSYYCSLTGDCWCVATGSDTGGSAGTGGATSASCNGPARPTTTGSIVVASSYATVGTLHGYPGAWVGSNSNTTTCITPDCTPTGCTPSFSGTALCGSGDVTADSTGNSCAGVSFYVNEPTLAASQEAITIPNSITFTVYLQGSYAGNSALRAYLHDKASGNNYCVQSGSWASGRPIPITDFNTQCWGPTTSAVFASPTTPITDVGVYVTSASTDHPFAFCLTNVTVQ